MQAYENRFIRTNDVTLHVVLAGPENGPPIILLHGFPEFWYGWRHQIDPLAEKGYRVVVPDQRGYHLSDKPRRVASYHIDKLARDVAALMDALGYEQVYLAGHDWGAAVAWWVATKYPQRLQKLAILNVPYPTILSRAILRGNWRQMKRSWYIFFFQLPRLPERLFRFTSSKDETNLLRASSYPGTFSNADLAVYRRAWDQPGALRGMINWYRAAVPVLASLPTPPPGAIRVPTLMLWGERDAALGKELVAPSIALCENGRVIFFPKATHWVQHDEAEAVTQHLSNFFSS